MTDPVLYSYGNFIVIDSNGNQVRNAVGNLYTIDDTAFVTPVPVTDLSGNTLTDIATDAKGYVAQQFQSDQSRLLWKNGDNPPIEIGSPQYYAQTAQDAVTAAVAAQAAAEAAAANTTAPTEAAVRTVITDDLADPATPTSIAVTDVATTAATPVADSAISAAIQSGGVIDSSLSDDNSAVNVTLRKTTGVRTFSANSYGADPSATSAVNTAAFQSANDAAVASGGGVVTALPGIYSVGSITQDSNVHFYLPDVTLSSATGDSDVITSRLTAVSGAVISAADLTVVNGASTTGLSVGQLVSIRYAGPVHPTQNTTLTAAVDAVQTTGITLTSTVGFLTSGTLLVGTELITYTGISGSALTGVTRGTFGSTAATHAAGDVIGVAAVLWTTVASIQSSTQFTLADAALRPVTGSQIRFGAYRPKITGPRILVNRNSGTTPNAYGVNWQHAHFGQMDKVYVENGDGGIYLAQGTSDCTLRDIHMHNCGMPEAPLGSALWLFQSCNRNKIDGITVTGAAWIAETLDDRSNEASEWDGPCNDNLLLHHRVRINQPGTGTNAINVTSCNRNEFSGGYIQGASVVGTGFITSRGAQGTTSDGVLATCDSNEFHSLRLVNCRTPWNISAGVNNTAHGITHDGAVADPVNGGNLSYGVKQARTTNVALGGGLEVRAGAFDIPSIAAGATANVTVTVTGALVGMLATAHPNSMPPAGLVWNAVVTAADTVQVRVANVTSSAIDPSAAVWRVRVTGNLT